MTATRSVAIDVPSSCCADASRAMPRWLCWGVLGLSIILAAVFFAVPFLAGSGGRPDLAIFADDFFYYVVIADRVLAGEGFTFDGVTPTNGFHPLWMAVLLAIGAVAPPRGPAFFPILHVVLCGAVLATGLACYRMLRETFGYAALGALTATLLAGVDAMLLIRSGMEIALAIPLIFVAIIAIGRLLEQPGFGRATTAALLAAAAILSRLDVAILFALVGVASIVAARRTGRLGALLAPRTLAGVALGSLPLVAYLGLNLLAFDGLLPISGRAKQLAEGLFFNPIAFAWFGWGLHQLALLQPFNPVLILTAVPALLTMQFLVLSTLRQTMPLAGRAPLAFAIVGFPFCYYAVLAIVSDWGIWGWYMYPVVPVTAVAMAGVIHATASHGSRRDAPLALPIALAVVAAAFVLDQAPRRSRTEAALVEAAHPLAAFAAVNPGRYAMGDRAGSFSFLTDQPVVQMEGLVGDPALLQAIQGRRSLLGELAARNVDYYVGTAMPREDGCWVANEPRSDQAGERSPRMSDLICRTPVFRYVGRDGVESLVFDLRPDARQAR